MPADQFQQRLLAGVTYDPKSQPAAVEDLAGVARDVMALNYRSQRHRPGTLAGFRELAWLKITNATEDLIAEAASLPKLEVLFLEGSKIVDVSPLSAAGRLTTLGVRNPKALASLASFATLRQLKVLALMNAPKVSDLSPIGELTGLDAFAADGSIERSWRLDSLAPLRSLVHLRSLFLTSTKIKDGQLAPLAALPALRVLYCAAEYSTAQFKLLMEANPTLGCPWIELIRQYGSLKAYRLRSTGTRSSSVH